jgi:DNA-binding CsgD family transcriptional regulator
MAKNIQSVIEAIQNAGSREEAFSEYTKIIPIFGYDNALFSLMTDHASIGEKAFHGVSTSFPEDWVSQYKLENYHVIDPVFQRILSKPGPFFWSQAETEMGRISTLEHSVQQRSFTMMREAEDAGVADGIGMSFVNDAGEIAGLGISRTHAENDRDPQTLADIYLLSLVFYEKYMSFYEALPLPVFTPREKEVLLWSSAGKTDWEIAIIAGISKATVRFHWTNIFRKMGVNNKMTATINAVRRKIVVPDGLIPQTASGE